LVARTQAAIGNWLRDKSADPVIRLEKEDLDQLKNLGTPDPLLGMSVLFRVSNDHIFIENAGGINAPALLGRFTVADENIAAAAQAMARTAGKPEPGNYLCRIAAPGRPAYR
jgi:hypothetical protein